MTVFVLLCKGNLAAGCQTKVDTSTTEPVQTDRHVREQAELVQTSEVSHVQYQSINQSLLLY